MRLWHLITLCFCVFLQTVQAGELIDQYDRFSQKKDLKWTSGIRSSDPKAMGMTASVYFKSADRPSGVIAHLAGGFDRLEYASCNSVYWLADNEPVQVIEQQYKAIPREGRPSHVEVFTSVFDLEQFQRLAAASLIEYKVCNTEGSVPSEDVAGIRQMLEHLQN